MARSTFFFLLLLSLFAGLLGYNYFFRPWAYLYDAQQEQIADNIDPTPLPSPETANPLSTRQQITQLIALPYLVSSKQSTQSASLDWIQENQPAIVTLFGEKISTSSATIDINKIKAFYSSDSQPLIAVDHEGGTVQRLAGSGFTRLPSWQTLCTSTTVESQDLLKKSIQELKTVGVNVIFAPVIDVASQSAVLGSRACSSDPEMVVEKTTELIKIAQRQQISPVIKHFPGIGKVTKDLHNDFDNVELTPDDIFVFEKLLTTYPDIGVMSTHVGIKDLYPDIPCSLNADCLDDLTSYFPKALVFSDALDMDAAGFEKDEEELVDLSQRALQALLAGNDILVFGPLVNIEEIEEVISVLVDAMDSNVSLQTQVQSSLKKLWIYQESLQQ